MRGDPLRPYLMLAGRGGLHGGLPPVGWQELHDAWIAIKPILEDVSLIGGSAWVIAGVRRLAAWLFVADRHGRAWSQRGAIPKDLVRLLDSFDQIEEGRQMSVLQALLGCSADEAAILLRLRRIRDAPSNDDETADFLAALLASNLLEHYRDADPQRWVARVVKEAPSDLAEFIPSERPDPPDDFSWNWPAD